MESWLTILLGLALLFFQGYSEKKKKDAAKTKRNIVNNEPFSNEPFFFSNEHEPEPDSVKERHEDILDTPKNVQFKPVDSIVQDENKVTAEEIKDVEEASEKPFTVDPKQLVIFSEIMKPKYLEQ